jgi:hypothetical protein
MSTLIDRLQAMALQPGWSRRRFLGQAVKSSVAVAAAAAGLSARTSGALAYNWECCRLEFSTWCSSANNRQCPSSACPAYQWNCMDPVFCAVWACVDCPQCSCSFGFKVCSCC